jgi:hypothetical protein
MVSLCSSRDSMPFVDACYGRLVRIAAQPEVA